MKKIKHVFHVWPILFLAAAFISSCNYTSDWPGNDENARRADTTPSKSNNDSVKKVDSLADGFLPPLLQTSHCSCAENGIYDSTGKLHVIGDSTKLGKHDGEVCIEVDEFSTELWTGGNPPVYEVPLVFCVMGNISKIYVNNVSLDFKTDEKNFAKVALGLGFGYNKFPIKIISGRGIEKDGLLEFNGTVKIDREENSND